MNLLPNQIRAMELNNSNKIWTCKLIYSRTALRNISILLNMCSELFPTIRTFSTWHFHVFCLKCMQCFVFYCRKPLNERKQSVSSQDWTMTVSKLKHYIQWNALFETQCIYNFFTQAK